jgi:BON domain-containing protein
MNKSIFLLGCGIVMALAVSAQTSSQTQTPPVTSTTPATGIGSGAQTKGVTPTPSTTSPAGQVNPAGTAQPPAQTTAPGAPATGGVAGAASSTAPRSSSAETSSGGIAAVTDADLESQIQNALNKEPTLTGDSTHVTVSSDAIELSGNVGTSKEKITATRIVQSYAGRKKVVNHLTVGGKTPPRSGPGEALDRDRPEGKNSPNDNSQPDKESRPAAAQPPLR